MFFTLFGYWVLSGGGGGQGIGTQLAYVVFHRDNLEMEVFETCFYVIVTTQYDHPSYVKHVLGRIHMIFTLFGY